MSYNPFPPSPPRFGKVVSGRWPYLVALGFILLLCSSAVLIAQEHRPFNKEAKGVPEDLHGKSDPPLPEATRVIDWPAKSAINGELRKRLRASIVLAVDQSPVPVLLPDINDAEQGTFLLNLGVGYSFSLTMSQRYSMVIYAFSLPPSATASTSRTSDSEQKNRVDDVVRGQGAHVAESEGIWRASWEEYGVRYRLDLSCGAKLTDEECHLLLAKVLDAMDLAGGSF